MRLRICEQCSAVLGPEKTYEQWKKIIELYGENSREALAKLDELLGAMIVLSQTGLELKSAAENINNKIVISENRRKLTSKDENKRPEVIALLFKNKVGEANSDATRLLAVRLQDIARESPEKTLELAVLISSLRNSPVDSNNYAQGAAAPAVMAALAYALISQVSTPENQERMRGAANTFIENSIQFTQATKEEAEN